MNKLELIQQLAENVYIHNKPTARYDETTLGKVFDSGLSKKARVQAALTLIHHFSPNYMNSRIAKMLEFKPDELPVSNLYKLSTMIGRGGTNHVFLLQGLVPDVDSYALKVPRRRQENPYIYARAMQQESREICSIFSSVSGLMLPEENFFVGKVTALTSRTTALSLQKFQAGSLRDVFTEVSSEELGSLLKSDSDLRDTFSGFVTVLREHPELLDKELDILGKKNLCLLSTGGGERLMLLDQHYRNLGNPLNKERASLIVRIEYLESLTNSVVTEG